MLSSHLPSADQTFPSSYLISIQASIVYNFSEKVITSKNIHNYKSTLHFFLQLIYIFVSLYLVRAFHLSYTYYIDI
jgi:hypothetical protein